MSIIVDNELFIQEDAALLKRTFPHADVGDPEHYRWKYFDNPHGESIVIKDIDNGKVIGRTGVLPQKLRPHLTGEEYVVGLGVDAAVDRSSRNCSVFTECWTRSIQTAKQRDYHVVYIMPNRNSYHAVTKRFGFKGLFSFSPMIYFPLFFSGNGSHLRTFFYNFVTMPLSLFSKARMFSVSRRIRLKEGFFNADEWYCMDSDILKDEKYVKWRYRECPTREYIFLAIMDGNDFLANVVLKPRRYSGIEILFVVDVFVSGRIVVGRDEVGFWLSRLSERLHKPLVFFANNLETRQSFGKAGFYKVPKKVVGRRFEVVGIVLSEEEDNRLSKLKLSLGDIDVG